MKIVEQYLRAVGSKLPWKSRRDITEELRSLLLDQIEADLGPDPDEEEVKKTITAFGSPTQVAARYRKSRGVISPGLTDLYFMIILIMAGAMFIAFITVFAVESLQDNPAGSELVKRILMVFVNTFGTWLSGVGGLTVVFIILSRFFSGSIDLDETWTVEDLKGIHLGDKLETLVNGDYE